MLSGGRPRRRAPGLGANFAESGGGLIVRRVAPEGPADKAGLRHGDRVAAIADAPIADLEAFYRALWSRGTAGVAVKLSVRRQGQDREIEVKTMDRYRYLRLDTTY